MFFPKFKTYEKTFYILINAAKNYQFQLIDTNKKLLLKIKA